MTGVKRYLVHSRQSLSACFNLSDSRSVPRVDRHQPGVANEQ